MIRVTALVFVVLPAASLAKDAFECPSMPAALTQINRNVKSDISASVGSLGKVKAGEVGVKTEIEAQSLLSKYPNADRIVVLQTMAATYCTMLRSSSLDDKEKLDRWERFQDRNLGLQANPPNISRPPLNAATKPPSEAPPESSVDQKTPGRSPGAPQPSVSVPAVRPVGSDNAKPTIKAPVATKTTSADVSATVTSATCVRSRDGKFRVDYFGEAKIPVGKDFYIQNESLFSHSDPYSKLTCTNWSQAKSQNICVRNSGQPALSSWKGYYVNENSRIREGGVLEISVATTWPDAGNSYLQLFDFKVTCRSQ
jgi:hypothetical protein